MYSDFPVTMTDVLPLLGISYPPGRRSFYMQCPCCNDTKKHLNINLVKSAFRCPRCGFHGGVLDLYAFYANTNKKQAFADIRDRLHLDAGNLQARKAPKPTQIADIDCPITDIDTRHATYTALLEMLTLASDHYQNLKSRGLSDDVIKQNQYRTMPVVGFSGIAKTLLRDGHYLAGVPGFYKDGSDNWTLAGIKRGILLPARDMEGRIQAIHVRLDDDSDGKFRWLSSVDRKMGCSAGSPVHIAGMVSETATLIEGVLKADIVNSLTEKCMISVQGVTALSTLDTALESMRRRGLKRVMTGFDMDYMVNPNVQRAMTELYKLLDRHGLSFGTNVWHPDYNGMDDYEWARIQGKV